ncbi:alpha-1,4 fucosyltransferase [Synechococcus phage S-SKS1]|uniref:Alpha-1,4 fucosyltransferase n=1 Tax=Synechococcus phage S-SKS1 TaxID=754042 RepID=M4R1H0_9CAUD|nr:alpha-1,4 fucosyltransferase [Synechococcus phage S-SKS1]AGH31562.1 alpha-1,4 fucosyltransferase [Synechococcus phage S-SKS1]
MWYLYIDWFEVNSYDNPDWLIPESYLYNDNEFTQKKKDKFCSIVYGKQIESRINAIQNICSNYKQIDVFGKANPNYYLPDGEKYKLDLISNYKFSLCYENSVTPGYHTEKLLHGKVAGNIPIYYGDKSIGEDFNPDCFINAVDMSDEELIQKIIELDQSDNLYNKMAKEPIFTEKVSLDNIKDFLFKSLS